MPLRCLVDFPLLILSNTLPAYQHRGLHHHVAPILSDGVISGQRPACSHLWPLETNLDQAASSLSLLAALILHVSFTSRPFLLLFLFLFLFIYKYYYYRIPPTVSSLLVTLLTVLAVLLSHVHIYRG
jgi:hypothetical protein